MHKRIVLFVSIYALVNPELASQTERFRGNTTPTWEQVIASYRELDQSYEEASLVEIGMSDAGKPLHLFIINKTKVFKLFDISASGRPILLVNNAIHPGEPCGVDACLQLARNILKKEGGEASKELDIGNTIVCIVPFYNIGGGLNRGCCSRANQNGPEEYGFRGSARNLDLNRDFIKCDSENSESFTKMFRALQPHVFVDTHTSNGADYQYTMTMISTQADKAGPVIGPYMQQEMDPWLYQRMKEKGWEMSPYVESVRETPDQGIYSFLETPRYSTGYATLFNTIGYVSETHMLKPYEDRVESTYQFLISLLEYMKVNGAALIELQRKAMEYTKHQELFPIRWKLDTTHCTLIDFKGYEAVYEPSEVTGSDRLRYDRTRPFEKKIRCYGKYTASKEVLKPDYYLVPYAWREVRERLVWNGVEYHQIKSDTIFRNAEVYYISDVNAPGSPYEGHYLHSKVEVNRLPLDVQAHSGDWLIPVNQACNRYIVETLEPEAHDAFFVWNFFDSVLQQKEWFSDYVFEDEAADMLRENPELNEEFERQKKVDASFASNPKAQLYFLYQRSGNFEITFNRYPIYRIFSREKVE
jgi:hypothetical protein